jgi:hypothetical protein
MNKSDRRPTLKKIKEKMSKAKKFYLMGNLMFREPSAGFKAGDSSR